MLPCFLALRRASILYGMSDTNGETPADELRRQFGQRAAEFSRLRIAARDDLRAHAEMPSDLWQAIGAAGLAGIALPVEYGGVGGDLRALAVAAEAMAEHGGNLGVVTSWMSRQLIARMQILCHGTAGQRARYLPALAAGQSTPCLAISEPGAGAHPKHLKTTAERDGDTFVLNGEKAYLTNGPIADIFLVLAITGMADTRKRYSVLIVPRDTPGVEPTEGVRIDYLRPSPHGGLKLRNVRVPADNLLGPEGDAFETISLPMRRTEDALFAASKAGAMRHILRALCREAVDLSDNETVAGELGRLVAASHGLAALAFRGAELLDIDPVAHADTVGAVAASAREWAASLQERITALIDDIALQPTPALAAACRDLEKSLGIARAAYTIQARRRGLALLESTTDNKPP